MMMPPRRGAVARLPARAANQALDRWSGVTSQNTLRARRTASRGDVTDRGVESMLTAADIMTRDVISVPRDMSVAETSELLTRYRIHGAPVVDSAGQLVGMVSLVDLVGRVGETVADVMTSDPISAGQDVSVEDVAGMMLDQMVRRVPIVEGGRVIGMVSASDIIRVFLNLHDTTGERPVERAAAPRARLVVPAGRTRRPGRKDARKGSRR